MVWGSTPWIKDFPYANVAYDYDFGPGESGVLKMEFWITPFDYAAVEGPGRSVVSQLTENELIGMSWCMIDFDVDRPKADPVMCLSHDFRMIRDASFLNAFRLMPLEETLRPKIAADWAFTEVDRDRRIVLFEDRSTGEIARREWDFGDGTKSPRNIRCTVMQSRRMDGDADRRRPGRARPPHQGVGGGDSVRADCRTILLINGSGKFIELPRSVYLNIFIQLADFALIIVWKCRAVFSAGAIAKPASP